LTSASGSLVEASVDGLRPHGILSLVILGDDQNAGSLDEWDRPEWAEYAGIASDIVGDVELGDGSRKGADGPIS
jgi:hypothetical protein